MAIDTTGAQKVHTRRLEINTFKADADAAVVEGTLKDACFVTRYLVNGEQRPPGTVHHMAVRMQVRGPALIIEEIEAEMIRVPREECRQTVNTLAPLAGMRITSGFTRKVKEMLGGPNGCAHLVSLVLAMAPAAVQGSWAAASQEPLDPSLYADRAMAFLTDTCWVWRKGGPLEQTQRRQLSNFLGTR